MKRQLLICAALLLTSLIPFPSNAQCGFDLTAARCKAAVEEELRASGVAVAEDSIEAAQVAKQVVASTTEEVLQLFNTGLSSALEGGAIPTLDDFLPKFKIFASAGGGEDGADSIVLEFNDILDLPTEDGYKITVALNRPVLFDPLLQTIDEAVRGNERDELERQIDDFDDVTVAFTYSPMTEKWGRSDHQLHSALFDALFVLADEQVVVPSVEADAALIVAGDILQRAIQSSDPDALRDRAESNRGYCASQLAAEGVLDNLAQLEFDFLTGNQLLCAVLAKNAALSSHVDDAQTAGETQSIDATSVGIVERYLTTMADVFREEYANLAALHKSLTTVGFFGLPELINNQPQLNFSGSYSSRNELVGQDEVSLKVSYEKGFVNVNSFREFSERSCEPGALHACLTGYLTPVRRQQLARGDRVTFNLEYSRKKAYDFALASGLGMLALPSEESLVASFGYGRYITFLKNGAGNSRIDISASYENVDGDSMRQDRLLGAATYSQRISDAAALSFSLSYANKPEFVGETGDDVMAHVGINYKMFSSKDL